MDKRVLKTKESIKKALMDLALEYDFNKITVKAIAEKANIGRKTFYLHYGCVDDVIDDFEKDFLDEMKQSMNKNFSNMEKDIHNIFIDLNNMIKKNLSFYKRIAKNDTYSVFRNIFEHILETAINEVYHKLYHTGSVNVGYYASFYSAGIMRLYFDYLREDISISLDEVTDIAMRACFLNLDDIINRKH